MSQAPNSGVRDIDPAIERLLADRDERMVFLNPVWLRTWLAEFGDRYDTVFLDCGDGEECLAIAPLMRDDHRLTFACDPEICDFMDFVVPSDGAPAAYDALWDAVVREDWSELVLWGLMASSPTRAFVKQRAVAAGYEVMEEVEAVAPRIELPASFEDYLASLGKKDRHELRRKMRRLLESGANVDLQVYSDQSDVVRMMDTFLELHTRSRMDKTEFMTAEMESFFRRMASSMSGIGLVRLFMLYVDDKPVATVFCFDAGSWLYMYNSGYDPDLSGLSVGLVSKALCLRWAIENGKKGLDFLRGNEPYKYDLGARDQEIYRITVRRPA